MTKVLIIGYGNALRTDDGAGVRAVKLLAGSYTSNPQVETQTCFQLFPELAEDISTATHVIFVDASDQGTPGKISLRQVTPSEDTAAFTHECAPASLLAASDHLYGSLPRAWLFTISGASFDVGDVFSIDVAASLPALVENIHRLIAECLHGQDSKPPAIPYTGESILHIVQ